LVFPFAGNYVDYVSLEIALGVCNQHRWLDMIPAGNRIVSHFVDKKVAAFPPDLWTWVLENVKVKKQKKSANSHVAKKRRLNFAGSAAVETREIGGHEVADIKAHFLTALQQCGKLSGKFRAQFHGVAMQHRGEAPRQYFSQRRRLSDWERESRVEELYEAWDGYDEYAMGFRRAVNFENWWKSGMILFD
jgi:hypothetical protein